MTSSPVVVHVGPDPAGPTVGGIASVIATLVATAPYPCSVIPSYWSKRRPHLGRLSRSLVAVGRVQRGAVIHVHMSEAGSWLREGAFVRVARWTGKGVAVTLHGAEWGEWVRRPAARRWVASVLRRADVVFTLQDGDAQMAGLLSTTPVVSACNPVVAGPDPARPEGAAEDAEAIVVFLGEQSDRKGVDVLTAAWPRVLARHPRARLVAAGPLTGDAPVRGASVQNLGPLAPEEARRLLRGATLAVLPSRAEALPMVLLEAMADGVPFIASDVAGIPRLAASGAGLLVPVGDVEALAAAIGRTLADPALRAEMGRAGRRWWGAHGTPAAVHEALCRGYRLAARDDGGSAARGGGSLRLTVPVRPRSRRPARTAPDALRG